MGVMFEMIDESQHSCSEGGGGKSDSLPPEVGMAFYWKCKRCGCWNVRGVVRCAECGRLIEPKRGSVFT